MPTPDEIGQGLVDLIRDHINEHAEFPFGFEGLVNSRHDNGLMVFDFADGSTFRAIVTQVWEPMTPPEVIEEPPSGEPEDAEEPPAENAEEPPVDEPEEPPVDTEEPPIGTVEDGTGEAARGA